MPDNHETQTSGVMPLGEDWSEAPGDATLHDFTPANGVGRLAGDAHLGDEAVERAAGAGDPPSACEQLGSEGAESAAPLSVEDALAMADALECSDLEGLKTLLKRCVESAFTPGERKMVGERVGKATGWTAATISSLIADARGHKPGHGVLSTRPMVSTAIFEQMKSEYDGAVFDEGGLHTYMSSSNPNAQGVPVAERDVWVRASVEEERDYVRKFTTGSPVAESLAAREDILNGTREISASTGFFAAAPAGVNAANGFVVVNLRDGGLVMQPHSASHRARVKLGVDFHCQAVAPHFRAGVGRVLPDPTRQRALKEAFAAALFRLRPPRDQERGAVIMVGPARTGKTTILQVLESFFPQEVIASVPPNVWNEPYSRAQLAGNHVNTVTELPSNRLVSGAHFKTIVSGEPFQARHPHEKAFTARFAGFHLFACNALPKTDDDTDGFARRLLIIKFEHPLALDEVSGGFLETVRRDELAGVLNWAAEAIPGMLDRGYFTLPDGHDEGLLQMQHPGDHVVRAARFGVERAPGGRLHTREAKALLRRTHEGMGLVGEADGNGEMRRFAGWLKKLYGAERGASNNDPYYAGVRLRSLATGGDGAPPVASAPSGRASIPIGPAQLRDLEMENL